MSALTRFPVAAQQADCLTGFEDFKNTIGTGDFTKAATSSATILTSATAVANGIAVYTPTAADNSYAFLQQVNELFLPANGRPMIFGWFHQYAENATNVANIAHGVANAPAAAGLLIDDGGGIRATGTLASIYKVDGETVWRCTSRNGNSNVTINQTAQTAGGTAYAYHEIEFVEFDSTKCKIFFRYGSGPNDVRPFLDATTNLPIFHTMLYASAVAMAMFGAIKNGSSTAEGLKDDFWWYSAKR